MAMILDAFAGRIVDKLAELVGEKVATVLGVKEELRSLQRTMGRIQPVLNDAERRRIGSEAVAGWVKELKDVMYDADDIIDLCIFEGGRLLEDQPSASSASPSACCGFPSLLSCFSSVRFRHQIGKRILNLNESLKKISEAKSGLDFAQNEPFAHVTRVDRHQTSPLVDASEIVGRGIKQATEELVELIIKEDEQKCPVYAITGMGGIGKTTLAQTIFNHQKIKSAFSAKIWVCISQNYSEVDLLKQIIRQAGGNYGNSQTKAELLPLLNSVISGRHFLLVLDDVWRADVWIDLLRNPALSGAMGSRVLITTRDRIVAVQMGQVHIHNVAELPVESGWKLLCKSIFAARKEEMESLREVGIQIVEKCHGLPLAIKTIAGLLITKERSQREWRKVLSRDAWSMNKLPEDLRGALYLSYEDLPSHLKQCFLYLSLWPEDYDLSCRDVVTYWMAEGFVETLELSKEYFEALFRRNLLRIIYPSSPDEYENMFYRMHDLLRSLAQFLSQGESFCGEVKELSTPFVSTLFVNTKLRRLRITPGEELAVIPETLARQQNLRTLFLGHCLKLGNDLFFKFSSLRVLSLSGSDIENIPDALGNLINLRLLALDRTKVSSLPESIKNLRNLLVLYLSGCDSLDTLPKGITQLRNLRCIRLTGTPLRYIPARVGRLECLNTLHGFFAGVEVIQSGEQQELGCKLEELESLLQLRQLSIYKLEKAVAHKGQLVLRSKPHLQILRCYWGTTVESTEEEIRKIEDVFEELVPPPCLESLHIEGYCGRGFSSWMMSSSLGTFLPQLRSLALRDCATVLQLPSLGLLPELIDLYIRNASGVVHMGFEFLGSDWGATSVYFPKLENLTICNMSNLEEWSFCGDEEDDLLVLPRLQRLNVSSCPKLKMLPRGLKQSGLRELWISKCQSLERVSELPALKLIIRKCPSMKCIEKVDALQQLFVSDPTMECLPEWLLELIQQKQQDRDDKFELLLWCHPNLLKECLMDCKYWPIIKNIPKFLVAAKPEYMEYSKQPFDYRTNFCFFPTIPRGNLRGWGDRGKGVRIPPPGIEHRAPSWE